MLAAIYVVLGIDKGCIFVTAHSVAFMYVFHIMTIPFIINTSSFSSDSNSILSTLRWQPQLQPHRGILL